MIRADLLLRYLGIDEFYVWSRSYDVRHAKTDLKHKVFVVVIPKEGWA